MKGRMDNIYRQNFIVMPGCLLSCQQKLLLIISFILFPFIATAQEPEYEEILVTVNIQGMSTIEMPAAIAGETLFLPVIDIFDYLKIKNTPSDDLDSINGFFISQENTFVLDQANNIIWYKNTSTNLQPGDFIKTETALYLKSDYLGKIFDLQAVFNFRALLVNISTKTELPVIREARLEAIRKNVRRLKGDIPVDSSYRRLNPLFHFGMTDWSVVSTQQPSLTDTRLNLGLGGMIAGGELNASVNYSTSLPFMEKQQFYLWRYVNNDNKAVKQVMAGKIPTPTVASVFAPIVGVQINNTPTTTKKTFGSYVLSNITEPDWVVELYVNNVLVDYVKADATGFFKFEVPLVYGNSVIKLRYYGPYGEERSKEENISIPFNFISPGKFEYNASAGIVEDDSLSRMARGALNYGLNKYVTVGTGLEYLSSVTSGSAMPFVNAAVRMGSGLLVFGEHNYNVRTKAGLFYRNTKNLQLELNYTNFKKGQKAVNNNALEERRAVASMPIKGRKTSMFTMLTLNQTILPITKYTTGEWMFSGTFRKVDARISTIGIFTQGLNPLVYTNLTLAFRLPKAIIFTPELQYQYTLNQFISAKAMVEKRVLRYGYIGLTFEENFKSKVRNMGLQLRYDFSFSQVSFTARSMNGNYALLEAARGSIMYDRKTNYLGINNSSSIGRSGVVIAPFLDINCNNRRDDNEPKVSGLKFRISSGRVQPESKDTTIRVTGLEPYNSYYIEFNNLSFDNISWQLSKKTLKIFAEPNMFRYIEVPISVFGEVSGTVNVIRNNASRGQGQVIVNIYRGDTLVAKTLSEPDGYFSYLGLPPGQYSARIDSAQMRKINMASSEPVSFSIASTREGDVVDGIEFNMYSKADTVQPEQVEIPRTDTVPTAAPVKKAAAKPKKKPAAAPNKKPAVNPAAKTKVTPQPAKNTTKQVKASAPVKPNTPPARPKPSNLQTKKQPVSKPAAKPVIKKPTPVTTQPINISLDTTTLITEAPIILIPDSIRQKLVADTSAILLPDTAARVSNIDSAAKAVPVTPANTPGLLQKIMSLFRRNNGN